MDLNRRNLLRALGLAGPAYFLPSALTGSSGGRAAAAASPTIPTRILFFYTPHGTLFRQWIKAPAGAAAASETSFDLGPILQPLLPFKDKLVVLEGLDWQTEYVDTISASNAHLNGQTHALSATSRAGSGTAGGISIDQFIAQKLSAPTPLPSLEMSARWNSDIAPFLTSWTGSGALVPPMTRPDAVFSRLFPQGPPVTGTQPATDPAVAAAARRKRSILDGVLGEFTALSRPLSTADRAKMDAHAALIRDLEMRIGIAAPTPSVACVAPPLGPIQQFNKDCSSPGDICIEESTSLFSSLAVAAFACDLTRVITLDMDMLSAKFGVADMHAFLHGVEDVYWYANDRWGTPIAGGTVPPTAMDPGNIKIANAFYATYAQNLATLLQGLDAVIEPDGKTLLDHTIVVWCGEIGSPGHNNSMVNYVVAGGGAANIRGGRYVSMPRTAPAKPQSGFPNSGLPHNNLFVSLANAVGLSGVTTFGNPGICTGPLTQL